MLKNECFVSIKSHVFELFKKSLPVHFVYHNFNHTLLVVEVACEIAKAERDSESEIRLLLITAWFHDTGFIRKTKNHEECSKEFAQAY